MMGGEAEKSEQTLRISMLASYKGRGLQHHGASHSDYSTNRNRRRSPATTMSLTSANEVNVQVDLENEKNANLRNVDEVVELTSSAAVELARGKINADHGYT